MAYGANELFSSATPSDRPTKRCAPKVLQPKTFANVGGGATYQPLTPVAYNTATAKWVVWANGGANGTGTILGFIWPDVVVADNANEVIGMVCLGGDIHFDDIPVVGGTLAQLKTACETLRDLGFTIQGLPNFR